MFHAASRCACGLSGVSASPSFAGPGHHVLVIHLSILLVQDGYLHACIIFLIIIIIILTSQKLIQPGSSRCSVLHRPRLLAMMEARVEQVGRYKCDNSVLMLHEITFFRLARSLRHSNSHPAGVDPVQHSTSARSGLNSPRARQCGVAAVSQGEGGEVAIHTSAQKHTCGTSGEECNV
ncbi:hypothetical protein FN846DRAFT_970335 [Sphaerosporella brunnea]|uniref:Uncharacterized protein n=1 Tax=Sphaerosporella brunnea TaxID=1250544 RepID=A0A5J5EJA1_9PEZI|nr:hypothetical protein FN846DRAFT_970335 [Sphaerosporella brunnea]